MSDEDLKNWMIIVGQMIRPYFTTQYTVEADSIKKAINGTTYQVVRPNHGLAHGLRQSMMAVKMVTLLLKDSPYHPISQWLQAQDEDFIFKVAMVAAFQRTGRKSEIGHHHNQKLYESYIHDDVKNFLKYARRYEDNFKDEEELLFFSSALMWTLKDSRNYLEIILSVSHKADLRRMRSFDANRIKKMINEELAGYSPTLTRKIWSLSGDHLEVTGDRDMVTQRGYQAKFYLTATDPKRIVGDLW